MTTNEEILAGVQEVKIAARLLVVKLYGENGFEGDITEIKKKLSVLDEIQVRSKVNRYIIMALSAAVVGGGSSVGIPKLIELLSQIN